MKWTYIIVQKIKAALALGIVFILVFATNLMDKNHFSELYESFSSVYEDRLLVESYIYELSGYLHQKKLAVEGLSEVNLADMNEVNRALNDSIEVLLVKYEATKLTEDEALLFTSLKKNMKELMLLEATYHKSDFAGEHEEVKAALEEQYRKLDANLDGLSEIQLLEGKHLIDNSRRIIASSNITSQLEIGILIVIGLIVQALIFTSKSMRPKISQNSSLN